MQRQPAIITVPKDSLTDVSTLSKLGYLAIGLFIAVYALTLAGSQSSDVKHGLTPILLVGTSFIVTIAGLVFSTTSQNMQIGLQMFCIYFAFFLILPGYHHTSINVYPFFYLSYVENIRIKSSIIVLVFVSTVIVSHNIFFSIRPYLFSYGSFDKFRLSLNTRTAAFILVLSIISAVVVLSVLGVNAFATRSAEFNITDLDTTSAGLLVDFPRTIISTALVYAFAARFFTRDRRFSSIMIAVCSILYIVAVWPLGQPRYKVFGFLLSVFFIVFNMSTVRARSVLTGGFVAGILILSPVYDSFTRGNKSLTEISLADGLTGYFTSGDYDGLQSINNAIIYVDSYGYTYGRQILSATLFFVPRTIWVGKGQPSGRIAAEAAGYKFTNISQPLPGELFIDFGYTGLVIGGILLGFCLAEADKWIGKNWNSGPQTRLLAGVFVGYSIIIYRGALLAIISGVIVGVIGILLVIKFGFGKLQLKSKR